MGKSVREFVNTGLAVTVKQESERLDKTRDHMDVVTKTVDDHKELWRLE